MTQMMPNLWMMMAVMSMIMMKTSMFENNTKTNLKMKTKIKFKNTKW